MRARTLACLLLLASLAAAAPATAASPRITFYFGLERPESAARAAFFAVGDPASPSYRRFASAASVGARFGATRGDAPRLPARRGAPRPARADRRLRRVRPRDRAGAPVRARPRREDPAPVHQRPERALLADPATTARRTSRPTWRRTCARSSPSTSARATGSGAAARTAAREPRNEGRWTGGCKQARATKGYAYAQVRHAYGLDAVGTGAGGSVALLNVGEGVPRARPGGVRALLRAAAAADARPDDRRAGGAVRPRHVRAAGGPRARARDGARAQLGHVHAGLAGVGPVVPRPGAGLRGAAASPTRSRCPTASASGTSAAARFGPSSRAGARLMDAVLVRLGLAGVGTFASAGDFGSTCNGQPYPRGGVARVLPVPHRRRRQPARRSTARTGGPARSSGTTCAGSRRPTAAARAAAASRARRPGRPTRPGWRCAATAARCPTWPRTRRCSPAGR